MLRDFSVGDVVQLRKHHPCGSDRWRVERTGADIRLLCLGCGRRVLLPRGRLERQVRAIVARQEAAGPTQDDRR